VRAAWSYYEELPLCRLTTSLRQNLEFEKPRQELSACSIVKTRTVDHMLKWILRVSFLVVSLSLLGSELSYSEDAFVSWKFQFRWIRHRNFLCYIEQISRGDKIGCKDARFRPVPGLAGKGYSLESVNFPGHFWRHENFRLKLHKFVDEKRFREDATFYYKRGLADRIRGRSFESFNFPRHRHTTEEF
jgi:Alpha-L-arabinofuranosidase B (ABFB) domain